MSPVKPENIELRFDLNWVSQSSHVEEVPTGPHPDKEHSNHQFITNQSYHSPINSLLETDIIYRSRLG